MIMMKMMAMRGNKLRMIMKRIYNFRKKKPKLQKKNTLRHWEDFAAHSSEKKYIFSWP